jgi:hypothetical protein
MLDIAGLALRRRPTWWIMMLGVGQREALALGAGARSTAPMLAACPMQYVFTSQVRNCMVS